MDPWRPYPYGSVQTKNMANTTPMAVESARVGDSGSDSDSECDCDCCEAGVCTCHYDCRCDFCYDTVRKEDMRIDNEIEQEEIQDELDQQNEMSDSDDDS